MFFLFFFGFCFSSLLSFLRFFNRQKTVFPLKKGHFLFIQCLPLFLFSLFGASPLSSLSLSLSLSCSFLSSFLPVFHFLLLVLAFSFCCVCFFCFKMFFCFCCSVCCLVLFWIITFHLCLLCILFSGCCCFVLVAFIFCYFLIFGNLSKTSLKNMEIRKTAKIKNAEKNGHFDKSW